MCTHALCETSRNCLHPCAFAHRPLGSSVLLGCYDKNGPQLYAMDPLGTCLRYFGAAVGKGRQVRMELEQGLSVLFYKQME